MTTVAHPTPPSPVAPAPANRTSWTATNELLARIDDLLEEQRPLAAAARAQLPLHHQTIIDIHTTRRTTRRTAGRTATSN